MGRDEGVRGWITCDPSGTWPELASRGTSGEAAGRLVEEKVGVTAGIVTTWYMVHNTSNVTLNSHHLSCARHPKTSVKCWWWADGLQATS